MTDQLQSTTGTPPVFVVTFTEGQFDGVTAFPLDSLEYVRGYAAGVRDGAGWFGGTLQAYLVPEALDVNGTWLTGLPARVQPHQIQIMHAALAKLQT